MKLKLDRSVDDFLPCFRTSQFRRQFCRRHKDILMKVRALDESETLGGIPCAQDTSINLGTSASTWMRRRRDQSNPFCSKLAILLTWDDFELNSAVEDLLAAGLNQMRR
jgi:hypothetical protein